MSAPESQRCVLGSILLDNRLLRCEALASLGVEDFSGSLDQSIFATMIELAEDGIAFDAIILAEALKPAKHFQNGDGAIYLAGCGKTRFGRGRSTTKRSCFHSTS